MNRIRIFSFLVMTLLLSLNFVGCSKVQIVLPNEANLESIVLSKSTDKIIHLLQSMEIKSLKILFIALNQTLKKQIRNQLMIYQQM